MLPEADSRPRGVPESNQTSAPVLPATRSTRRSSIGLARGPPPQRLASAWRPGMSVPRRPWTGPRASRRALALPPKERHAKASRRLLLSRPPSNDVLSFGIQIAEPEP